MQFLRTNTATRITVGPFLDKTDGVTPETALTVTSCKLTMTVDDGGVPTLVLDTNPTASGGNNDMVHITGDDAGYYDLELTAANVNYLGRAKLALTDAATHCPVFMEFMIVPAMVYDSLILGTDVLQADVTQWLGTAPLALSSQQVQAIVPDTQKVDLNTIKTNPVVNAGTVTFPTTATLASTTNITAGTITTATNVTTVNGLAANVITAASIATDAIDADALAADAVTEISAGILAATVDSTSVSNILKWVKAAATGKCVVTFISGTSYTYDYYANDNTTIVVTTTASLGNRTAPTRS